MKVGLAATLLFAFLGVAVFGFVAMHHAAAGHVPLCLANYARSQGCPENDAVFLHANLFRSFSLAVFGLILSVLVLFSFVIGGKIRAPEPQRVGFVRWSLVTASPFVWKKLIEWFENKEKRDPTF